MEKFQELRDEAKKKIRLADHMITMTYPLVKDPKMLMSALENIFLALANAMGSILYYERTFKHIPPFSDSFDSKFNMFRSKVMEKHKINNKYAMLLQDMKEIILANKKSPVSFTRHDRFVICSDDYKNMMSITADTIKQHIAQAKDFIVIADSIVSRNEEIFVKNHPS